MVSGKVVGRLVYFALQFLRLRNNSAWWNENGTTGSGDYVEVLVLQLAPFILRA